MTAGSFRMGAAGFFSSPGKSNQAPSGQKDAWVASPLRLTLFRSHCLEHRDLLFQIFSLTLWATVSSIVIFRQRKDQAKRFVTFFTVKFISGHGAPPKNGYRPMVSECRTQGRCKRQSRRNIRPCESERTTIQIRSYRLDMYSDPFLGSGPI